MQPKLGDFGETFQLFVLFVDVLHTCFAGLSQNEKVGESYDRGVTDFFAIPQFWELPPQKKTFGRSFCKTHFGSFEVGWPTGSHQEVSAKATSRGAERSNKRGANKEILLISIEVMWYSDPSIIVNADVLYIFTPWEPLTSSIPFRKKNQHGIDPHFKKIGNLIGEMVQKLAAKSVSYI